MNPIELAALLGVDLPAKPEPIPVADLKPGMVVYQCPEFDDYDVAILADGVVGAAVVSHGGVVRIVYVHNDVAQEIEREHSYTRVSARKVAGYGVDFYRTQRDAWAAAIWYELGLQASGPLAWVRRAARELAEGGVS